ncbi:MAG: gamma-glutamyltransferase family protein [Candidatus Tectimicrobiota bacterium]
MAKQQDQEHTEVARGATGRPVVRGTHGLVASGHYLTSMAGMRMLLSGGNAFDAAVAMGLAAAVIEPTASYSLATEGVGMLYHAATGTMQALSGQGVAPQAATVAAFRARGLTKIPTGPGDQAHLSFTVPGIVDGYLTLLETYGTKTLGETLAPAIDYATHGFPMYEYMHRILQIPDTLAQFQRYPAGGAAVFYPNGQVPPVGSLFVQTQLGQTLRLLAEAERATPGHRRAGLQAARRLFYEGEIARRIVAFSAQVGGLLQREDLQHYHARLEEPIRTTFAGYEICTQSTWTQAAVLLQALNMLEHVDLRALGHNSPAYIHTITEVIKLAFADRERYYGDPQYAAVPLAGLLSKAYAAARVKLVGTQAYPGLPEPGDPARPGASVAPAPLPWATITPELAGMTSEEGTTHLAALDRDGNMVCITPSGGVFRKSAFVPDLGCTLSTRSEMFFLDDDHPNGLEPGKRPRTTLINYFLCRDGVPVMTFGCPGGDDQAQANLQMMLNVLVFGMDPQQAVEAPRFASQSGINSFYPRSYAPGRLNLEERIPETVAQQLRALGHQITRVGACGIGAIITQRHPETGALAAGADPRRPTYALGW